MPTPNIHWLDSWSATTLLSITIKAGDCGEADHPGVSYSLHRLYNPWLHSGFVLVFGVLGIALAWSTLDQLQTQEWLAVPLTLLLGYLTYEVFHTCGHLPHSNAITRLPWIRQMRRLHELHHHRELMQACNFDVVFPLMDYLFGTLYWQAEPDHSDAQSTQRP